MKKTISFLAVVMALASMSSHGAERPAPIDVRIEPQAFSPNNDGYQDFTFFSPVVSGTADIVRWRIDVLNARRKVVVRLTGAGFSSLIRWDGRDRKGAPVPDGEYDVQLTIWTSSRQDAPPRKVVLDTQAPTVAVNLKNPELDANVLKGKPLVIVPQVVDNFSIDRWQVQVMDHTGQTVHIFWSSGPVREISWNGIQQKTGLLVPKGAYRCALQAWDRAANESEPVLADFTMNVAPSEMLQGALELIRVTETDLGLLVQLPADVLFSGNRKKPAFRKQAIPFLKELGILINAYPGVPIQIDGYSRSNKAFNVDRDLSSLYAWTVYSHLVKSEGVLPSRISVKGRARSPLFDRRAVAVPVVQSGVEILLKGQGPW